MQKINISKFDYNLVVITLFIYITALILFDNSYLLKILYFCNILLFTIFLYIKIKYNKLFSLHYNKIIIIYFLFVLFNLFSIIWAINKEYALLKSITLILVLINSVIIYNMLRLTARSINIYLTPFFVGTLINLFVFKGYFGSYDIFYQDHRFVGLSTNSNLLSIYLLFSIFASLYFIIQKNNFFIQFYLYVNITLSLYLIVFTNSKKGSIFSLILLFIFLVKYYKPNKKIFIKIFKFLLMITIFYFLITNYYPDIELFLKNYNIIEHRIQNLINVFNGGSTDISTRYRIYYTQKALEIFYNNPLVGIGSDNFKVYAGEYSHNNHTELLADNGIIGYMLYYSMYGTISYHLIKCRCKHLFVVYPFIVILVTMDLAYVSYYMKITLLMLLVISIVIKNGEKYEK